MDHEVFRNHVLAHTLKQSELYRTAANREAPFDVTECTWRGDRKVGKATASCTLHTDGTADRREYDGKPTALYFAIDENGTNAVVSSASPESFGHGRGFMVEANGQVGRMWMS